MADDNMKLGVDVGVKVTGEQSLEALDKEIKDLAKRVGSGDKEALKALNAKTNAYNALTQGVKQNNKATEARIKTEQRARALELEWIKEQRQAQKEGRLADKEKETRANRAEAKAERARKAEKAEHFRQVRAVQRVSAMKDSYFASEIKQMAAARATQVKNFLYGQNLRRNTEREQEASNRRQVSALRNLENMRARHERSIERTANAEKKMGDARQRHAINQQNTLAGMNQFMNRHIGLLQYRGSIEERYASEGLKNMRSQMAGAMRQYRQDQRAAVAKGSYDAAEEQRIQNKFQTQMKAARRAFNTNMAFGRAEQQAENARMRNMEKLEREAERRRERNQRETFQSAGQAASHGSHALNSARTPGLMAAAGAAATAAAIKHGISSRMDVDTAETNLKIFGGSGSEKITQADVEKTRKAWLDRESMKHGLSMASGLNVYTEIKKSGLKNPEENTKNIMAATTGLELPVGSTSKLMGTIGRNLGSGATPEKLKRVLNAIGVSAREDPTQSAEIVEGINRAYGALATGNLDVEDLPALVSGGQSVGIQPGKAGTFIATLTKQLSSGNDKFIDPKKKKQLNFAARELNRANPELGFTSGKSMAQKYTGDSKNTIYGVLQALKNMSADKRTQVAFALSGNQWNDEDLQIVNGLEGMQNTDREVNDPKNANFLDEARAEKMKSWQGMWNQSKSIFGRFWESFGMGFDEILRDINSYFYDVGTNFDYDVLSGYVKDFLGGIKEAIGIASWKDLLKGMFSGDVAGYGSKIREFAKGLTEGFMAIGRMIKSVFVAFSGGSGDPRAIGDFAGKIIGLSLALVALSPVLSIFGGMISLILALAASGRAIAGVVRMAGLGAGAAGGAAGAAGMAGMGASLMRGVGLMLSRLFTLGLVAEIGANRGVITTWMLEGIKSLWEALLAGIKYGFSGAGMKEIFKSIGSELIPAPIQRWLESSPAQNTGPSNALGNATNGIQVAPQGRGMLGKAWDWITSSIVGSAHAEEGVPPPNSPQNRVMQKTNENLEKLNNTLEESARFQRQSYQEMGGGSGGLAGMIHKAAVMSGTTAMGGRTSTPYEGSTGGISGSFGGAGYRLGGSPLSDSVPGSALGQGGGRLSSRGIIGGSSSYGGGGAASGPIAGRMKSVYDSFRSAGLSHESAKSFAAEIGRENDFNPNLMYGSHIDPHNKKRNAGMMSWQGDRAEKLMARLREGGHLNPDGSIKRTQESLNAQAQFAVEEMKSGALGPKGQRALGVLNNPNATHADRALALGDDVIKWRQHDPRYASHAQKRDRYYNQMEGVSQGAQTSIGTSPAIAGLGDGKGQYEGLRVKGAQAIGNGAAYKGVTDLARQAQESLPGGVKHFSAFNDHFHAGRNSKHNQGLAFDTTLIDGSKSSEAAEAMRNKMRSAGLRDEMFKVIDEYKNPSGHSTGGHIHTQFNSAEAAKTYSDYIASLKQGSGGDVAAKAGEIKSSGWRPGMGNNSNPAEGAPSANLGTNAPMRQSNTQPTISPSAGAGGGGGGGAAPVIQINGSGMDHEAIANAVQRKLTNDMGRRTHDVETMI